MTRFWFDTEFIEDGRTIDLISIGIVSEDNRKYYAVSSECDPTKASKWVNLNVLSQVDWSLALTSIQNLVIQPFLLISLWRVMYDKRLHKIPI